MDYIEACLRSARFVRACVAGKCSQGVFIINPETGNQYHINSQLNNLLTFINISRNMLFWVKRFVRDEGNCHRCHYTGHHSVARRAAGRRAVRRRVHGRAGQRRHPLRHGPRFHLCRAFRAERNIHASVQHQHAGTRCHGRAGHLVPVHRRYGHFADDRADHERETSLRRERTSSTISRTSCKKSKNVFLLCPSIRNRSF